MYLAALKQGMTLDTMVLDEPISVGTDGAGGIKWIANYDNEFKGPSVPREVEKGIDRYLATQEEMSTASMASQLGPW